MIYVDSCYVVKCYVMEPGTPEVRELFADADGVASCVHARVEFMAAVHRHYREQRLTAAEVTDAVEDFERDCRSGFWKWLELDNALGSRAFEVIRGLPDSVFIRAGDALHLACAAAKGFSEVFSNDRHLLKAAPFFGVRGTNVIPSR